MIRVVKKASGSYLSHFHLSEAPSKIPTSKSSTAEVSNSNSEEEPKPPQSPPSKIPSKTIPVKKAIPVKKVVKKAKKVHFPFNSYI